MEFCGLGPKYLICQDEYIHFKAKSVRLNFNNGLISE